MIGKSVSWSDQPNVANDAIALILSAGMGRRLRPLTLEMPKPLVKIGGIPIIEHQLQVMEANGIRKIVVVLGYKSSMIEDVLLKSEHNKFLKIIKNPEYQSTNNLYSLYLAFEYLKDELCAQKHQQIILVNGDVVFDETILTDVLRSNRNQIAVDVGRYFKESMKITVDGTRCVKKISKEISETESLGVSIDLYSFDLMTWREFETVVSSLIEEENLKNAWTEDALQILLDKGLHKFSPLSIKGRYWFEVDTLEDLKEAERLFHLFQKAKSIMKKRLFIFDLDGTVFIGDTVLPMIRDFLNLLLKKKKTIVFLTNNSSMSKQKHLERLRRLLHSELRERNIYTSIEDTIRYLKSKSIKKIFLLATPSVSNEFVDNGFILSCDRIDAVVVTFDKSLSYEKLEKASLLLRSDEKVKFVLTNRDLRCPTEKGAIPDAGSIGGLLETVSDRKIDFFGGKPNPEMITNLLLRNGMSNGDCVFFGDRLYTDINMGDQSKIMTVLMLTGETKLLELNLSFLKKYVVLKDFQELLGLIKE